MATIKSFTSLEQSRKLAEILPLESADMYHFIHEVNTVGVGYKKEAAEFYSDTEFEYIPCWSLAVLLDVLPDSIYDNTNEFSQLEFSKKSAAYHDINDGIKIGALKDNLIDACYELILKLHELQMLQL